MNWMTTLLAVCALLGGGCISSEVHQAYPGAPQPPEKTCLLQVPAMLDVRAIDGIPTDYSLRIKKSPTQELSLLTGSHRLQVKYYDPMADESRHEIYEAGPFDVTFVSEAGSVYELKYETVLNHPELRITGQKARVWAALVKPGTP